ncbi:hypothetical protein DMH01_41020 [Amycolatopsis sp. WAC 04182]|uniref:hypothetical protein n=1 Tax=Amycolatopsis sp. WAC 04182 TaxID=2203198 RepID=UPI000F78D2E8|nr:hypothetical protein [Amycolatopsis sp. WAC 04182]RSN52562.1 hypothetical protein DMH01_41020 [Amycolatopsis sp. WAC 04182]
MWTWRRKEPGSPSESPAPATLPTTRAEWRSLPPIQRVVAEHPLINPVQRFSSSLTSWRSPAYLEPLGHRVGPAEPAGVIGGLAHPRTTSARVPDMPVVQRSARKRGVLSRLWGMSVQRTAEPAAPVSESLAPEPESVPSAATAQPEELLPDEPGPVFEPTATFVLPAVVTESREADRPPMPLTSAVASARPPMRTVQAVRSETPSSPLHEPVSAVEPTPAPAEPLPPETPQPDLGPIVPEPELADAEPFESVPVGTPDPLPAEQTAEPPVSKVVTPPPVEPPRPALPVVQRTERIEPAPRRLGLGAPILPDSGDARASVPSGVEPGVAVPVPAVEENVAAADVPAPVAEDDLAEADAPLAGAVETSALPTVPADETSTREPVAPEPPLPVARIVQEEAPLPVARIVADEEWVPPAASVETPTSAPSLTSTPTTVQRSVAEPSRELPSPERLDVARPEASVQRPVQRLRAESPGTRENAPPVDAPVLVSRAVEPPPNLPMVTSSRPSPEDTFHPFEQIRSATTETFEPPGPPGGSVSAVSTVSPAPTAPTSTTSTSPLPVARIVDGAATASPAPLSELPVSRVTEVPRITRPLPSVRVVGGSTPRAVQRAGEPSPFVSATLAAEAGTVSQVAPRKDVGTAVLPVVRSAEPAPYPPTPNVGTPMSTEPIGLPGPLPVARSAEVVNHRGSTMDTLRTAQRTAASEPIAHGTGFVLDLPPVVMPRQAETPVVQREPEPAPPPPAAPPVAEPEPAAAGPTAAPAPASQPETEELVKKLFDPLLRRLKTELRLDRERRGALTDRPH